MNDSKLKIVISWASFIICLFFIVIGLLFPITMKILSPVLFPKLNINVYNDWLQSAGVFVSFASAGLGIFSIYQALSSNKDAQKMLNMIRKIKTDMESVKKDINTIMPTAKQSEKTEADTSSDWVKDDDNE